MTITNDGEEGSTLPPSQRDLSDLESFVRAHTRNFRTLSQGFTTGRLVTPRLVTSNSEDEDGLGDSGDEADTTQYEWEWDDRWTTVDDPGIVPIVVYLSHIPVDESLFVRWHPGGLTNAGVPVLNQAFTLVGNVVTFYFNPVYLTGDGFSFQYQFDPGLEPGGVEVIGATLAADSCDTSLELPAGTVAGSILYLVLWDSPGSVGPGTSDPRLTLDQSWSIPFNKFRVYKGVEDGSGDPVTIDLECGFADGANAALLAFSPSTISDTQVLTSDSAYPMLIPPGAVSTTQALAVIWPRAGGVIDTLTDTSNQWETVVEARSQDGFNSVEFVVLLWTSNAVGLSPPGAFELTPTSVLPSAYSAVVSNINQVVS